MREKKKGQNVSWEIRIKQSQQICAMIFHSGFQKHVALWEPTSAVRLSLDTYYIRSYCRNPLKIVAPINIVPGSPQKKGGSLHFNPMQIFSQFLILTGAYNNLKRSSNIPENLVIGIIQKMCSNCLETQLQQSRTLLL